MLDPVFNWLSPYIGAPPDHLKLIFSFLISYPLASLYPLFPSSAPLDQSLKHVFTILTSTFFIVGLFKMYWGWVQLMGLSCGVWWLCKVGWVGVLGMKRGDGRLGWLVFVIAMGSLLLNHIHREIAAIPSSVIEITGPQMVLTMKLIQFAWNCVDGGRPDAELDQMQLATRLRDVPDLLSFLGYCFFFPSMIVGPAFDYASYASLISSTLYTSPPATSSTSALASSSSPSSSTSTRASSVPSTSLTRLGPPRGRHTAAYRKLVTGLLFIGAYAAFGGMMDYMRVLDDGFWYGKGMAGWGWRKFGWIQLAGLVARTKYYGIWSMSEGACIMSGLGFNGYSPVTGATLWDRVKNIDLVGIETAESFKVLFDSWNCRTNVWLKETVYKRVTPRGKKPGKNSQLVTFAVSALWHGISPGYYMAFITASVVTSVSKDMRRLLRPFFLPATTTSKKSQSILPSLKPAYDFAGWFLVQSSINYIVSAFLILSLKGSAKAWWRMGMYGHVLALVGYVALEAGGKKWLIGMNRKMGNDLGRGKKVEIAGKKEL